MSSSFVVEIPPSIIFSVKWFQSLKRQNPSKLRIILGIGLVRSNSDDGYRVGRLQVVRTGSEISSPTASNC